MSRHRVPYLAATASLILSLPSPTLMAQPPPAARAGGAGGLGTNLLGLVTNPAVQAELKATEAQKAHLKALSEQDEEQRLRWLERMGIGRPDVAGNRGDGKSRGGGDPPGRAVGTGGGRRLDNSPDAEQQDPFATMLEARQQIQRSTERSIARILSQAQYARARQIQLQTEGPAALLRPEMQERLYLSEDQVAEILELMQERRQSMRETRDARNALRESALDRDPALGRLKEQLAWNVPQVRNGVDDPVGQDGRRNDPGNNPAYREARNQARRRFDEDRESQKQMATFRAQDEAIEKQFNAALYSSILTRRQSQAYRKMLGAPFNPPRSPGVAKGGPNRPDAARGARATAATSEMGAASRPQGQATAKPRRMSLREQRGLGPSDDRP
ncbi:MAG: hypothetical protein ACLQGP_09905 [Isosphaeraceae bacterium]